jgi:CRISPR/Cas system-associated exonuclease Cas4 (RecB family)
MISKSKIMASLQCSKKLWLLVNKPDVSNAKDSMEFARARGNELGELARVLYSANEQGTLVNPSISGFVDACQQTKALMKGVSPIFEATFISNDELAMADIMVSDKVSGGWQMIEVKSASNPKSHYIDDLSIQVRIAEKSGANITKASIAYINSSFVYGGDGNYQGLLNEVDIPLNTLASKDTVNRWIDNAAAIIATDAEPSCNTGLHCSSPYECEFRSYCSSMEVQVSNPVSWLPNVRSKALKQFIATGARDMSEIPDSFVERTTIESKTVHLVRRNFF